MTSPEPGGTPEEVVIKQHWHAWNALVEAKGWIDEVARDEKNFEFGIDRRDQETSFFTADFVALCKLKIPLEKYIGNTTIKSKRGEKWITLDVSPKNPFRPRIGIFHEGDADYYYTEIAGVYLSNLGRAFEASTWGMVLEPDEHPVQKPGFSYLRRYPEAEEVEVEFQREPEPWMDLIESFQPLKGGTLERLDFLLMKVRRGEII